MENNKLMGLRKIFCLAVLSLALISVAFGQITVEERLKQHVYTLASDSLMGRKAGSEYAKKAADYIVSQWEEAGLTPLEGDSYFRPITPAPYQNIVAVIEGNDALLRDRYIIVGAHYDHLGAKVNAKGETVIYNGADDNASGVAILIELGRRLQSVQSTLRRSVILIAFDAEEIGLFGSDDFAANPPFPLENIDLMISVDMVGWYGKSGYVKYSGSGTIKNGKELLLDKALVPDGLHVKSQNFEKSVFTATDTRGFAVKGVPTLSVTTGFKSPYHKPADMAHLIDYQGMSIITEHLVNVVQSISQDDSYEASGKIASKHKSNQKFIFGISANIGSNYHFYTRGSLDGKPASAYSFGLNGQLNMNHFALRPEVYYDYILAEHPQGTIETHGFTVPLHLMLQSNPSGVGVLAIFAGPYYSYKFSGKQGKKSLDFENIFRREEAGISFGAEMRVSNICLGVTYRNGLTNFSRAKNADNAHIRNRATFAHLGFLF